MKSKAKPRSQRGDTRPTINSALLLGPPPGRGRPSAPGPRSPTAGGWGGAASDGSGLVGSRWARGKAQAMWGLREAPPCYWLSARHSALSAPGPVGSVWRKAPVWGVNRGGWGQGAGEKSKRSPAQGWALPAAAARSGAPGPRSSTRCPALRREAGQAPSAPPRPPARPLPGRGSTALGRSAQRALRSPPSLCPSPLRCLTSACAS